MNCYITNPFEKSILPTELNKDNTLFYPEAGMTTRQLYTTLRPRDFHIVTDSHWLVGLYKMDEVFIWDEERQEWENPDFQTYGCAYELLLHRLWGVKHSIPAVVMSNKEATNCLGSNLK